MNSQQLPEVSLISVNYKVADMLSQMLQSVPEAVGSGTYEIVVVDNASEDGSVEVLRKGFPEVNVVANPRNVGFGAGCNVGARHAKGAFLAFVNPDVVLDPGSIAKLVELLKARPHAGIVGPEIVLPDGSVQSFAGRRRTNLAVLEAMRGAPLFAARGAPARQPQRCGIVHGACFITPRAAFDAIGGIPENTFMYGEEALLGHRLDRAGFEVWYDPTVRVRHADGSAADRRFEPHEKALKKRWGHVVALGGILPRPSFYAWNLIMAGRSLASGVGSRLIRSEPAAPHLDFVRLHLRALSPHAHQSEYVPR